MYVCESLLARLEPCIWGVNRGLGGEMDMNLALALGERAREERESVCVCE